MTALSTYSSHHPVFGMCMLQKMHSFRYLIDSLFNYRCLDVGRPAGDQLETSSTRTSSHQLEASSKSTALETQLEKTSC